MNLKKHILVALARNIEVNLNRERPVSSSGSIIVNLTFMLLLTIPIGMRVVEVFCDRQEIVNDRYYVLLQILATVAPFFRHCIEESSCSSAHYRQAQQTRRLERR